MVPYFLLFTSVVLFLTLKERKQIQHWHQSWNLDSHGADGPTMVVWDDWQSWDQVVATCLVRNETYGAELSCLSRLGLSILLLLEPLLVHLSQPLCTGPNVYPIGVSWYVEQSYQPLVGYRSFWDRVLNWVCLESILCIHFMHFILHFIQGGKKKKKKKR